MSRRDAREKAMQLLYQIESQPGDTELQIEAFMAERTPLPEKAEQAALADDVDKTGKPAFVPLDENDRVFLEQLVRGVKDEAAELDGLYSEFLVKWKPERLPRLERILLRLGTYEIVKSEDVPDSVAINETVNLARKYADEESYAYINAVLGKVSLKYGEGAAASESEA